MQLRYEKLLVNGVLLQLFMILLLTSTSIQKKINMSSLSSEYMVLFDIPPNTLTQKLVTLTENLFIELKPVLD